MDLSVQKMLPPSALKKKSEAKKSNPTSGDDAVEDVARDQRVRFSHGNTGYDKAEGDDSDHTEEENDERQSRRKNRQLISGEDLTELTSSFETLQQVDAEADNLLHRRAYAAKQVSEEEQQSPKLEINI